MSDASSSGVTPLCDGLTAPAGAVPRRDPAVLSLGDCLRAFARRPSPPVLAGAVVAALAVRGLLGDFGWRDLVMVGGILLVTPLVEWAIHVYLLHARPLPWRGRSLELIAAREHRAHHRAPSELDGVLIPPYAVLIFVAQIALTNWLVSFPVHLVLGGDRLACAATATVAGFVVLAVYEWLHFLIHTPYRPRRRYYRTLWRSHRLHHFKNENFWFGVTSPVGDRLLGTAPDARAVERSATARTLEG